MVGILGANSVSGGYEISNSLRFNNDDSPRLTFTPSSAGNRRTFTLSVWFKLGDTVTTGERVLLAADDGTGGNNNFDYIAINGTDRIFVYGYTGSENQQVMTAGLLRDPSAWYHLVFAYDTTQSTAADRVKIYLNGSRVTDIATGNYPSLNLQSKWNNNNAQRISSYPDQDASYFDGYMAEYHLVDGAQKAPSDFGEFDDNGVWIPKKYTGDYGTNGFYLEFKETGTSQNSSGIGADTSGNDHHWAVTNLAATDVTTDTPTNNFMTLNPLAKAALAANPTEGNLIHAGQTSGYAQTVLGTLAWHGSGGKWYWEMEQGGANAGNYGFIRTDRPDGTNGVGNIVQTTSSQPAEVVAYDWAWGVNPSNGNSRHDGSNGSYGSALGNGDHGMVAVDTVAGKAWWGKNGTWFASGNPATGANPAFTDSDMTEGIFTIYSMVSDTDGRIKRYNFGNPPTGFAIASGNADANGYGNFEYAPPSGYYSLCTKNLGEFG